MILNLSGEVGYEMLNALIKAYNDIKEEELHIYFSSPEGGLTDVAEAIIDFINSRNKISLTFYGEVFSAGMVILLKTTCPKKILPDTRGMFHFSWQELTISEGGKPNGAYDIFSMKEMKESKIRTIEYLKNTKMTEKDLKGIKNGKDIFFSYSRMQELI